MTAAQLPLEIEQGADCVFSVQLSGGPADLNGYTGAMQIRPMKNDPVALYTLDPSHIAFDAGNRLVTVRLPAADTASFDWDRGVYDVLISGSDGDWRIAEGKVTIDHWVTRG